MSTKIEMHVPYTYLTQEFDPDKPLGKRILAGIAEEMRYGRYTLGPAVYRLEEQWAATCRVKHAIGVGNGTDALFLILKAMNLAKNSHIAIVPITFVATAGAIIAAGHRPQFADIEPRLIEMKKHRVAAYPILVHWAGQPDMAASYQGKCIEDACQAIGASWNGQPVGSLGLAAAFSLHPLKNVNIMGDGGIVTTDDDALAAEVRLLRNHGLVGRELWRKPGYNSRLDTIQAIIAIEALENLWRVTECRIANAKRYDDGLRGIWEVTVPPRLSYVKHVYHLYQIQVEWRDQLVAYLNSRGIEAKIHYPTPLHLQPALAYLRYKRGDFPNAERFCNMHISLPIHQYLTTDQIDYVIQAIREFYRKDAGPGTVLSKGFPPHLKE